MNVCKKKIEHRDYRQRENGDSLKQMGAIFTSCRVYKCLRDGDIHVNLLMASEFEMS